MKTTEELHAELQESTEKIISAINSVPDEKLNNKPTPDKWSAGECAEHIILTETLINRLLRGKGTPAGRDPESMMAPFLEKFGDMELKLTAFGPIIPSEKPKEKAELIKRITSNRAYMDSVVDTMDLTELLPSFKHPLFGLLTRYEWIQFNIHHAERHRKQMLKAAAVM